MLLKNNIYCYQTYILKLFHYILSIGIRKRLYPFRIIIHSKKNTNYRNFVKCITRSYLLLLYYFYCGYIKQLPETSPIKCNLYLPPTRKYFNMNKEETSLYLVGFVFVFSGRQRDNYISSSCTFFIAHLFNFKLQLVIENKTLECKKGNDPKDFTNQET